MTQKDIFTYLFLLIVAIAGFFVGNFAGGIMVGSSVCLLFFALLGKYLVKKGTDRINKAVRDIVTDSE
jgi:hypothetical protein